MAAEQPRTKREKQRIRKIFPAGGFVLVGGRSERMGRDKALLEVGGKPLLLRTVGLLRTCVVEVALLGPPERYAGFGIPVYPDRIPGRGPLAALCTGLETSPYEWNAFLACDLPFLEGRFVRKLLERALAAHSDAVVPRTQEGWQPLCAAYHRRCLPVFHQALRRPTVGIVDLLPRLRVDAFGEEEMMQLGFQGRMFENVNTLEQWAEAQRAWETRGI